MIFKVTKNGKPQGCEYADPAMAQSMARTLREVVPEHEFKVIAMESDLLVLEELVAMDCNRYEAAPLEQSFDRMHRV